MPNWAKKRQKTEPKRSLLGMTRIINKRAGWYSLLEWARTNNPSNYIHFLDNAYKFEQSSGFHINEYSTNDTPYNWQKTE